MLEAVINGYESVFASPELTGAVVLDGTESIESIAAQIQHILKERFAIGE